MIIACNNCYKKFTIDANLIPTEGRLLQCSSCNHKWFFKSEVVTESIKPINDKKNENFDIDEKINIFDTTAIKQNNLLDINEKIKIDDNSNLSLEKVLEKDTYKEVKKKKNYNILGLIIIFIISFVAIIILIDTFKVPLGKFLPDIEFFLYNFYESIKDAILFFKDLI